MEKEFVWNKLISLESDVAEILNEAIREKNKMK